MKAKRKLIGLLMFAMLFVAGGAVLVLSGGDDGGSAAVEQPIEDTRTTQVLTVTADIQAGVSANSSTLLSAVTLQEVPLTAVASDAIDSVEKLQALGDVKLVDPVAIGTPLTESMFAALTFNQAIESVETPPGLLRMTFNIESQRVLGGNLRPGDHIAVIASYTDPTRLSHIVLSNVLVTRFEGDNAGLVAEQANTEAVAAAQRGSYVVTVAVDAPSAEKLTHVLEYGKMWLAAQPADANLDGIAVQDVTSVLGAEIVSEIVTQTTGAAG
ncbi:MAG: RcpC/CpaB family pilus assembly protein [Acidimicrobiia bacterium]|nr:RcpC/CpaB family pilus assembly protein [Acidimicrobiia bacterium]